jgi:hypothetical protein
LGGGGQISSSFEDAPFLHRDDGRPVELHRNRGALIFLKRIKCRHHSLGRRRKSSTSRFGKFFNLISFK